MVTIFRINFVKYTESYFLPSFLPSIVYYYYYYYYYRIRICRLLSKTTGNPDTSTTHQPRTSVHPITR